MKKGQPCRVTLGPWRGLAVQAARTRGVGSSPFSGEFSDAPVHVCVCGTLTRSPNAPPKLAQPPEPLILRGSSYPQPGPIVLHALFLNRPLCQSTSPALCVRTSPLPTLLLAPIEAFPDALDDLRCPCSLPLQGTLYFLL